MSGHEKPDAPGLWKAAHGGYGVMFHDDGEPAMLLFGPGAKVRALDAIGPYTRLQPGVPVGSAPVPNLPGLWMDKDGSLYFLSGGRRVWRIRDDHDWMEWQANHLSAAVLMPKCSVDLVVRPFRDKLKNPVSRALLVANLSNCFDVSIQAATNRLKDLGYIKTSDTTDYSYASAIMDFAGVVGS